MIIIESILDTNKSTLLFGHLHYLVFDMLSKN